MTAGAFWVHGSPARPRRVFRMNPCVEPEIAYDRGIECCPDYFFRPLVYRLWGGLCGGARHETRVRALPVGSVAATNRRAPTERGGGVAAGAEPAGDGARGGGGARLDDARGRGCADQDPGHILADGASVVLPAVKRLPVCGWILIASLKAARWHRTTRAA